MQHNLYHLQTLLLLKCLGLLDSQYLLVRLSLSLPLFLCRLWDVSAHNVRGGYSLHLDDLRRSCVLDASHDAEFQ